MNRIRIHLLCFLMGFGLLYGAPEHPVLIQLPEQDQFVTGPRQIVTVVLRVTSFFESEDEFIEELRLPAGWKPITESVPFEISPEETQVRMVSFLVSSNEAAGDYQVFYRVHSRRNPSSGDQAVFSVHVRPVRKIQLVLVQVPEMIMTGEKFEIRALLTNASNVADTIEIKPGRLEDFDYTLYRTRYIMNPMESREIIFHLKTHSGMVQKTKSVIQISAFSVHAPENQTLISTYVQLIPSRTEKPEVYYRFPVNVALKHTWQDHPHERSGNQIDVSGKGSLDEAGKHSLRFRIRTPDQYRTSVLGEYSEYSAVYANSQWELGLGDQYFTVSPLLENSQYASGISLHYKKSRYTAGAYMNQTRFLFQKEKQAAAFFNAGFAGGHFLQLNYLHKNLSVNGRFTDSDMMSMEYRTSINPRNRIVLEYAVTPSKNNGNAVHADLDGEYRNINYDFKYYWADKNFYGYYSNRSLIMSTLDYKLTDRIKLLARINQNENRYLSDSSMVKIYSDNQDFGIRYQLLKTVSLTAAYGARAQKDEQIRSRFDYQDRMMVFQAAWNFKKNSLSTRVEYGKTHDFLLNRSRKMNRISFNAVCNAFTGQSYQVYLLYDKSGYNSVFNQQYLNYGAGADFDIWKNARISLNIQNYFTPESYYTDRNSLHLKLSQTFRNIHSVGLQVRKTYMQNGGRSQKTAVLLQYNLLLDVPVSKKKNIGFVGGRVIHQATGDPIPGVIVRINGYETVTDESGRYLFKGLAPGIHYLYIDKARIGLDHVCSSKLPAAVEVAAGQVTDIPLSVVESGRIAGKIITYKVVNDTSDHFAADKMSRHLDEYFLTGKKQTEGQSVTNGKTRLLPDYPLANILVELKRDDETLKQMTDSEGNFSFQDLRPGTWILSVSEKNLPQYSRLEQQSFTFELKPGDSVDQPVKVLPQRRRIRFQNGMDVIEVKP